MTRPPLHEIPLSAVTLEAGSVIITCSPGQWDALLAAGYERGYTLLELDASEKPAKAYRICYCELCARN